MGAALIPVAVVLWVLIPARLLNGTWLPTGGNHDTED
jgi:hypothetical protein